MNPILNQFLNFYNETFDFINSFLVYFIDKITVSYRPSIFGPVFPYTRIPINEIDQLYLEGVFPKISGLAPAIIYCVLFSIARYILQHYIVKPFAIKAMDLKNIQFTSNKKYDKYFKNMKKDYDVSLYEYIFIILFSLFKHYNLILSLL